MNKIAKHNISNKIAIVLLVVLLCNFLMPNYSVYGSAAVAGHIHRTHKEKSQNDNDDNDGSADSFLAKFFCGIGDLVMVELHKEILGNGVKYNNSFAFTYTPATIFSGTLAVFDINFISPMKKEDRYIITKEREEIDGRYTILAVLTDDDGNIVSRYYTSDLDEFKTEEEYRPGEDLIRRSDVYQYAKKLEDTYGRNDEDVISTVEGKNIDWALRQVEEEGKNLVALYSEWIKKTDNNHLEEYKIYISYNVALEGSNNFFYDGMLGRKYSVSIYRTEYEKKPAVESIALTLRSTIATWYRVCREIAIVGLLSILVYVSIMSIISSSTENKAKYKKLLFDWFTAVIIVFTLHFIISITLTVTKSISNIFSSKIVTPDGVDNVMSGIRNNVETDFNFWTITIYYYLIIMTIKYTIQYVKRVIYVAFLTMIAPLIGLTYPLDRIKDGQAQAFTSWMREFVFTALLQPLHLILYYIFIQDTAMSDFGQNNPILALIVLTFLPQAEKLLRKMFGFDKAGNLGNMKAAFGGAAVMNMINKLRPSGGGKAPKMANNSGNTSKNTKIREAKVEENPYAALIEDGEGRQLSEIENLNLERIREVTGAQINTQQNRRTQESSGQSTVAQTILGQNTSAQTILGQNTSAQTILGQNTSAQRRMGQNTKAQRRMGQNTKTQRRQTAQQQENDTATRRKNNKRQNRGRRSAGTVIKGVASVGGKVFTATAKGGIRVAGGLTFGTIGLAAGLATGDLDKAVLGAAGGFAAGRRLSNSLIQRAQSIPARFSRANNNAMEIEREDGNEETRNVGGRNAQARNGERRNGATEEGERNYEERQREKTRKIREIKRTREYKDLLEKYKDKEEDVNKLLNAGITDVNKIRIALDNSNNYSTDNAIAYINMAKLCPAEIFKDREKFKSYLEANGIPKSKADEIYRAVEQFR